ncbi:hypothetical protein MPTK1_2g16370 [Marchantia polymorpha subsp. ruderalis]|uniref:Uncharacterized protein n=1 Tax=Marchantia polymorpha TaxID=3197 RepID=A0A2R6W9R7_MARPO|nr:hypothetical protein MARPO_0122s0027 [Marchantia polymorpha]BBN02573.1 hypothetical protein Mp_2g16370 [Marchantia polymorpha subsp. ruderalis]|eukprot:PTQ30596.1 hypothetical protein MARPO_0122s0027 [Marchantia polymorpha]
MHQPGKRMTPADEEGRAKHDVRDPSNPKTFRSGLHGNFRIGLLLHVLKALNSRPGRVCYFVYPFADCTTETLGRKLERIVALLASQPRLLWDLKCDGGNQCELVRVGDKDGPLATPATVNARRVSATFRCSVEPFRLRSSKDSESMSFR